MSDSAPQLFQDPTLETMSSYVPRRLLRRLVEESAPISEAKSETFESVVLFADISGFTALAERLARSGPDGAEALTLVLNGYFEILIDLIERYGGDVLKFAGDALLAIWSAESGPLESALQRAAFCSLEIQRVLKENATLQPYGLRLRIGLSAGQISIAQVGGVYGRWELLVSGEPLYHVAAAESLAEPGSVVISPQAWSLLQGWAQVKPLPVWGLQLEQVDAVELEPSAMPVIFPQVSLDVILRPYLPRAILTRLAAGHSGWLAELRQVTVLFIGLPGFGINLEKPQNLAEAQRVMSALQSALYRYEGSINKLNVDDKGVTLVAAFGLPPLAHEDDAVRGVLAAFEVQRVLSDEQLQQTAGAPAIGIATGQVFCGSVGSSGRREYTMLGDTVNLAARLMQAVHAEAGLLCDQTTFQLAGRRIEFATLDPLRVRGKDQLVPVFRPLAEHKSYAVHAAGTQTAMVGRNAERAQISALLEALASGEPLQILSVEADAGMGKSRLVEETLRLSHAAGLTAWLGAGDSIQKSTPFFAWREIFTQMLGLQADSSSAAQAKQALAALPPAQHLRAPLLKTVLPGLELPENETTQSLSGSARAEATHELLLDILQAAAVQAPRLIILEDAHWLDTASWELAAGAARRVRPLALMMANRPLEEDVPPAFRSLMQMFGARKLVLGAFSADETRDLLCRRLRLRNLDPRVADFIVAKADGNPFFSEELAYALRDAGWLLVEDGNGGLAPGVDLEALSLPTTVQGVITGRIDRLPPNQQLTLKVASVIGRVFQMRVLHDIYPIVDHRPDLLAHLSNLEALDLTPLETPAPDLAYIFKHAITHNVAYNLLPYARRSSLHQAVAEWYEQIYRADLSPYYAILAHHWEIARRPEQAVYYLDLAACQALDLSAFHEARSFSERALSVLHLEYLSGDTPTPDGAIENPENLMQAAALMLLTGKSYWGEGMIEPALRYLQATARICRQVGHLALLSEALCEGSRVLFEKGNWQGGLQMAADALEIARRTGNSHLIAASMAQMGYLNLRVRQLDESETYFIQAMRLFEELGEHARAARAVNGLGLTYAHRDRMDLAAQYFLQYMELARQYGNRRDVCLSLMNLGEVEYWREDYVSGLEHLQQSLRHALVVGDRVAISVDHILLGMLHLTVGKRGEARSHFCTGLEMALQITSPLWLLYAIAGSVQLYALDHSPLETAAVLGLALRHPLSNHEIQRMANLKLDILQAQLSPTEFTAALEGGAQLDVSETARRILQALSSSQ